MGRLANKLALITGAGQGIGRAIALRFAEEGCNLAVVDLNLASAQETATLAQALGVATHAIAGNVTDRASVETVFAEVQAALGPIDILVNNAGIFENTQFEELSFQQWQRMLDVNVNGAFHVSQTYIRHLLSRQRGGAIVNVSSVSGQIAFNGSSHYNVSKAAISELTRCLAVEFGQFGIRTNALAPGIIETAMTRPALSDPALSAEWKQRIPMRSYGTVEHVADLALFLASDEAAYINGEIVTIDGGAVPAWSKPGDATRAIRRDWYPPGQ